MPLSGAKGKSRLRDGGFVEQWCHPFAPYWRINGNEAGDGQRSRQKRCIGRQPQSGKGARRMGVVVGMARRVQHGGRGERMGGVPAVGHAHRHRFAVRGVGAGQAVMLDIVGQQDLQAGPASGRRTPCNRKQATATGHPSTGSAAKPPAGWQRQGRKAVRTDGASGRHGTCSAVKKGFVCI